MSESTQITSLEPCLESLLVEERWLSRQTKERALDEHLFTELFGVEVDGVYPYDFNTSRKDDRGN